MSSDESYAPPVGRVDPNLSESCIVKRLSRRRGTTGLPRTTKNIQTRRIASSEQEQSSSDDSSEDSDHPVYRKSHSVLPSLKLRTDDATGGSPPKRAPPCVRVPSPWIPPLQEPYVDVFVDGACSHNGRGEPRAGIGVWFVPDDPLNVSQPARGRQTNNAAEIEAAVNAALKAQNDGIKKLRINTDSKYLVSSATEWIPTWEKNDSKTAENKPVKNRTEFKKLKKALEPMEVIWNHVQGHNCIEGNETADRIAREGIEGRALLSYESKQDADNHSGPLKTIVDVPPLPVDSGDKEFDIETLKGDLQKSSSQFKKFVERIGLDISNINPHSLDWDHEGMDTENVPVCIHVSEGEEDEELLENLKALDPCGEFDDDAFPKRAQDFLEQYEERISGPSAKPDQANETLSNPLQNPEEGSEIKGEKSQSPRLSPRYTNVKRKSMVRFKHFPEDVESPII